jgi:hypothetical protein
MNVSLHVGTFYSLPWFLHMHERYSDGHVSGFPLHLYK